MFYDSKALYDLLHKFDNKSDAMIVSLYTVSFYTTNRFFLLHFTLSMALSDMNKI